MKIKVSEDAKRLEALQRAHEAKTEPEVPEAIRDLLGDSAEAQRYFNHRIIEAYRRGKEGK